jgi:hypothetical protein
MHFVSTFGGGNARAASNEYQRWNRSQSDNIDY